MTEDKAWANYDRLVKDGATGQYLDETRAAIRAALRATPVADTAGIDAARLATAICASRPPEPAKDSDLFVDDECRGLARRVVAEYERLSVAAAPRHSAVWLAATKPDSLAAALRTPKPEGDAT